jgi:hypothetical protein
VAAAAFPSSVRGPVDFAAFILFDSAFFCVFMVVNGVEVDGFSSRSPIRKMSPSPNQNEVFDNVRIMN